MNQWDGPKVNRTPETANEHYTPPARSASAPTVQPPTREQIAEALWELDMGLPWTTNPQWQAQYLERADAVLALFPQPTPSAEPTIPVPLTLMRELRDSVGYPGGPAVAVQPALAAARAVAAVLTPLAAPPNIADMAPGTTFTASYGKDPSGTTRWMRCTGTSRCVNVGGVRFDAYAIDPSTIRDITPPPATSDGGQ